MRRKPQTQWRYLLNTDPDNLEVHDLDNEQTGSNECQINEIIQAKNSQYLKAANNEAELINWLRQHPNYDGCMHCLPHLHRK